MIKIGILFALLAILSYGTAQNLDKKNKRYENFVFEQKQNPDLKLVMMTYQILNDKVENANSQLLKRKLAECEKIISYNIDNNSITVFFINDFLESTLISIFKDCQISVNTLQKTYYYEH